MRKINRSVLLNTLRMSIPDLFAEIYFGLTSNKARSGLTILGIVIGIASVIAMVGIGSGAQNSIQASIQSIGSNLITISPGAQSSGQVRTTSSVQTLTLDDAEAIEKDVTGVKGVAPQTSGRYQITASGNNTNTSVTGTKPAYAVVRNINVAEGAFFTDTQVKSVAKVAVLGPTTRDDLFGEGASAIGKTIRINKIGFKVIGITESKGGSGFGNADDAIYIPITTHMQFLSGSDKLANISVAAENEEEIASVESQLTALLLERHGISDPEAADFSILKQSDIAATATAATSTFTILLAAIASISLLVGGIGIMNMMLTTVTERTREIGLRKAIGAKRADIVLQFLGEALLLTLIGGIIGIVLGWGLATVVGNAFNMDTGISLSSVLLACGVSSAIGIIFGFYPAYRASKLNPIEALRYE
jgi:putative ABC transport system permease protein